MEGCCGRLIRRNLVLEELRVKRLSVVQEHNLLGRMLKLAKNIHHVSGQLSVYLFIFFYLINTNYCVVEKFFSVVGSKVKSRSDGHRNLVSSIATELLKESKQKLTQIHYCSRDTNCLRFQSDGFKGQGHTSVRERRHTDRRCAIGDHLVITHLLHQSTWHCEVKLTSLTSAMLSLLSLSWHGQPEKSLSDSTRENTCGNSLLLANRLQWYIYVVCRTFLF